MKTPTYNRRRQALGQQYSRTLFVIPSGSELGRSHSVSYRFKAASDFFYLTGLEIADAVLLVLGDKHWLLHSSTVDAVWGEKIGLSSDLLTPDSSLILESLERQDEILKDLVLACDRVAMPIGRSLKLESLLVSQLTYGRGQRNRAGPPPAICDSRTLVGTLRLVKEADEILYLREAGARTSYVHSLMLQQNWVGKTERELCNWIEGHFLLQNMQWTAYQTIVGSSNRSTLLHARATERRIQEQDWLLVDAGGEWQGYCADITRAFPAGHHFSSAQKRIYETVLAAQKHALQKIAPGTSLQEIHTCTLQSLTDNLQRLGFSSEWVQKNLSHLMPHSTSHWIGLDVHDPSPYKDDNGQNIRLQVGMCFTVEPGLYFRERELSAEYYGLGVRIEDDVLVTHQGYELLSHVPKEIDELEHLRRLAK